MAKRVYPSWLPPNPQERDGLRLIRYRQRVVIVWLVALAPVGWIAAAVTRNDSIFVPLTLFWIIVGIWLAERITRMPCPRCKRKFCERTRLPFWFSLFNQKCERCGLTLEKPEDQSVVK